MSRRLVGLAAACVLVACEATGGDSDVSTQSAGDVTSATTEASPPAPATSAGSAASSAVPSGSEAAADGLTLSLVEYVEPPGYGPVRARSLVALGDTAVLLGVRPDDDGAFLTSTDLTNWSEGASWIESFDGSQRLRDLVVHEGRWVGVYDEEPLSTPDLAWWATTDDAGKTWQEDALPEAVAQPGSGVTGIVAAGGGVVATGWFGTDLSSERVKAVAWHSPDGQDWTRTLLAETDGRSVSPRQPFTAGSTVFVPGVESAQDEDGSVVQSTAVVWSSTDGGETFREQTLPHVGAQPTPLFGVATDDGVLVFGWGGGGADIVAWRSTDDGATWTALSADTFAVDGAQTFPYGVVGADDCLLLAGAAGDPEAEHQRGALWRSCDSGESWTRVADEAITRLGIADVADLAVVGDRTILVTNSGDDGTVRLVEIG